MKPHQRTEAEKQERPTFHDRLAAARQRDGGRGPYMVQHYCENPRCDAREIVAKLKESYGPPHVGPLAVCPYCREELNCHWVATWSEYLAEQDRTARMSVNAQLYRRDNQRDFGVPAAALHDELPDAHWLKRT